MLFDLQKMVTDEKSNIDVVTNLDININPSQKEIVTKSNLQEPKIVTESVNNTQLGLLDLAISNQAEILKPLTALELSRRFSKTDSFVTTKKYQLKNKLDEFFIVLKNSDPQNIGWQYSEADKKYHPIIENQDLRTGSD